MADGGEAWNKHYLGSNDGTTASTRCRRARRSCWCEESENEAREEEEIADGAAGVARAEREALGSGGEKRKRGRE